MSWLVYTAKYYCLPLSLILSVISGGLTVSFPFFFHPKKVYRLPVRTALIMGIFFLIIFAVFLITLFADVSFLSEYFPKHPL
jgi:EamA domain-containing membrane protein RarD